jgi:hypothetical protein
MQSLCCRRRQRKDICHKANVSTERATVWTRHTSSNSGKVGTYPCELCKQT